MNVKYPSTVTRPQTLYTWFLNSSKSKTRLKFMRLGMLSWSGINTVVQILSHLGKSWVYASHKPELLATSMMVFDRERPTFGDETISIASYCFQVFFSCQHRTTGVLCEFLWFFGVRMDILCINWVFNAFMCIFQFWTTCTCSNAYKLDENSNPCPLLHA